MMYSDGGFYELIASALHPKYTDVVCVRSLACLNTTIPSPSSTIPSSKPALTSMNPYARHLINCDTGFIGFQRPVQHQARVHMGFHQGWIHLHSAQPLFGALCLLEGAQLVSAQPDRCRGPLPVCVSQEHLHP